jgi:hypothetical protein
MSDAHRKPYWQRRPYRSQIIILMPLGLAPFLFGATVTILLLPIDLLREMFAP